MYEIEDISVLEVSIKIRVREKNGISTKPTNIYICCDPLTMEPRYIGKTVKPVHVRIREHTTKVNNTYSNKWFHKIKVPYYFIVEIVPPGENWAEAEQFWIAYFKSLGARLTNLSFGGEGTTGYKLSDEAKDKIRVKSKGRIVSKETRIKLSIGSLGKEKSKLHRERMSKSNKLRCLGVFRTEEDRLAIAAGMIGLVPTPRSEQAKRNMSESQKGHSVSESCKENIRKALIGRKLSEEHKAHISESGKGRKFTEDHKEKISSALTGKVRTAEHCAKISDGKKGKNKGPMPPEVLAKKMAAYYKNKETKEILAAWSCAL